MGAATCLACALCVDAVHADELPTPALASNGVHLVPYLPRYTTAEVVPAPAASPIAPADSLSPAEAVLTPAVPEPVPLPTPATPQFKLVGGESIETQLRGWATSAGWKLVWNVEPDWIVPNDQAYDGDFKAAATRAIKDLAANGANVVADGYPDNRTFIVHEGGSD
ncbi:hypothetical protein CFB47_39620 [Burkholderia sp. AU27893]|nr:hypothetical protein [Burkholderia contaminans]OXI51641.1 hypothetical protein CFB47_39620 [Burkholderia sp. AU27893]MBA9842758.1 hypothetical protein [Burkholderia contaminans]MBA9867551.1 hypothetical protein [Burkholderia contaminans]MBA9910159.1 hypothetical protein [Burkholderia contaminans]